MNVLSMAHLPSGTVTFLFTDIEGSTGLWEQHPETMRLAVSDHNCLLRDAIERSQGAVFKLVGDGLCAAFDGAPRAVAAALELQLALLAHPWPPPLAAPTSGGLGELRVRVALHRGDGVPRDGDYLGPPVNRVARLLDAGHGGQILLSQSACEAVQDALPDGAGLRELGAHRLKGLPHPESIFQLLHPRLPAEFPPLRSLEAFASHFPSEAIGFIGQERELSDGRGVAVFLEGLAREAGVRGQAERAARLFGAAAALRERAGAARPPDERQDYAEHLSEVAAQLGPKTFMAAWSDGSSMTLEQAAAYAKEETGDA